MRVVLLGREAARRMPWRDGGGTTNEIARQPARGEPFDWRASIAEIDREGPFSLFAGYERCLVLLSGAGLELRVDDAPPVLLGRSGQMLAFGGESQVACRPVDGPVRAFNLLTARGRVAQRVLFRPLVGPMVLFQESGVQWLVHVLGGQVAEQHAAAGAARAEAGATLWLTPDGATRQTVLAGAGELLLARIEAS
ncbi:MAG: HutD family protein [Pseudomonadota bacterium]